MIVDCTGVKAEDETVEGTVEKVELDLGASREGSRTGETYFYYSLILA